MLKSNFTCRTGWREKIRILVIGDSNCNVVEEIISSASMILKSKQDNSADFWGGWKVLQKLIDETVLSSYYSELSETFVVGISPISIHDSS